MLTAILTISGASVLTTSCSNEKGQLLEIYDVHGTEATARLKIDGEVLFTTSVYIGKNGIGKEGDAMTPAGTMHVLNAFGVKPNPGTTMPYVDVSSSIFACDDSCEYYNQIIDTAQVHHPCGGEDMFHTVPEYNYGLATDFNQEGIWPKGSNIFIHCKGQKTWTGGCVAFDEERMVELLKRCDTSLIIRVLD